jgi:lipoate-protein ligase A
MKYLDRTFCTPQENLACDEALLDWREEGLGNEILRFWEPHEHFVVLGYSNRSRAEVHLDSCQALGIPVFRRCSGGGTVLQGPGCLNYSLTLRIETDSPLAGITTANAFIMNRHRDALNPLLNDNILIQGHTDLTFNGLKFSGNSQRRKRRFLLFHGSFLLGADLALIERVLPMPSRQPPYRQNRSHQEFLTNLRVSAQCVKEALLQTWNATEPLADLPLDRMRALATDRYSSDDWTFKF